MASILANRADVLAAVEGAGSIAEVLRRLKMSVSGDAYNSLRKYADRHGIELPDGRQLEPVYRRQALEALLTANSNASSSNLRQRLVREGYLENRCYGEGCPVDGPIWLGRPITLQLDHINGVHNDNRLENLRILCPNCHTQTETWGGRPRRQPPRFCRDCTRPVSAASLRCNPCAAVARHNPTKIEWPSNEDLQRMVEVKGYSATGRSLGVSDNAVRKRLRETS